MPQVKLKAGCMDISIFYNYIIISYIYIYYIYRTFNGLSTKFFKIIDF